MIEKPKVVVFAASMGCQYVLASLSQQHILAGVILPDPSELGNRALEAHNLAAQLKQADIPFQYCCKAKLPLIHQQLQAWQVNLGVILGYPHILPTELLDYFATSSNLGLYNIHASKLPLYPGPSPIYWQIRNGEKDTAVVLHRVEQQVDSGNLVAIRPLVITALDTLLSLTNRIAVETSALLQDLLDALKTTGKPSLDIPQQHTSSADQDIVSNQQAHGIDKAALKYARKPTEQDYQVDFSTMSAQQISAMCRAGNSLPYSAVIYVHNVPVNLVQASPVDTPTYGTEPGTVVFIGDSEGLIVSTKSGALRLDVIATAEGIFNGQTFAEYFRLNAGTQLVPSLSLSLKQQA